MIRPLLILQFPLLLLTAMLAGSRAYWVAQSLIPLYAAVLLGFVALHLALRRWRSRLARPALAAPIFVACAATAVWVYRPLHLGVWSDTSIAQAFGLAALGAVSLTAAEIGSQWDGGGRLALPGALAILALLWLPGLEYPLIPLLFAGLVPLAALPLLGRSGAASDAAGEPPGGASGGLPGEAAGAPDWAGGRMGGRVGSRAGERLGPGTLATYAIFLAAFDLSAIVWQLQQQSDWAGHLALGLGGAAAAALAAARAPRRVLVAAVLWSAVSLLLAIARPDFELLAAHSLGAGLGLGAGLAHLARTRGATALVGSSLAWGLGMSLRLGFAQFGIVPGWRLLLLAPLPYLLWRAFRPLRATPEEAAESPAAAAPSPTARWAPFELALFSLALCADLWWLRHVDNPLLWTATQLAILALLVSSIVRRSPVRRKTAAAAGGWGEPLLFTLLACLALAAVGAALRSEPFDELRLFALGWPLAEQASAAGTALAHALMQQAALLGLVWPASRDLFGDRPPAYALAATLFGLAHLPNLALVGTTFALAWIWIALFRRGGSAAALVLSHAILAPWAYAQLPERTLHDLHVGRKAVERAGNYAMLETEASRRLLRRLCSHDDAGAARGSDASFVAELFSEVLGRAPTAAEIERWTAKIRRRSRCTAAKMLVMSDESVARHPGHAP